MTSEEVLTETRRLLSLGLPGNSSSPISLSEGITPPFLPEVRVATEEEPFRRGFP